MAVIVAGFLFFISFAFGALAMKCYFAFLNRVWEEHRGPWIKYFAGPAEAHRRFSELSFTRSMSAQVTMMLWSIGMNIPHEIRSDARTMRTMVWMRMCGFAQGASVIAMASILASL